MFCITVKTKTKNVIYRRWPKKGAELGEGGRKLEVRKLKGPEIKGNKVITLLPVEFDT